MLFALLPGALKTLTSTGLISFSLLGEILKPSKNGFTELLLKLLLKLLFLGSLFILLLFSLF